MESGENLGNDQTVEALQDCLQLNQYDILISY